MKIAIQPLLRFGITTAALVLALLLGRSLWNHYMYSPWTRDARMRAEVVRIAPDVSGLVTRVTVVDNQEVKKGDILFEIDPDASVSPATGRSEPRLCKGQRPRRWCEHRRRDGQRRRAPDRIRHAPGTGDPPPGPGRCGAEGGAQQREVGGRFGMAAWKEAQASGHQAGAAREQAQAAVALAQVAVEQSRLDLERTQVRAPVDGYVTNLAIRAGDYAATGSPYVALIDKHSYYIYGYFEETKLPRLYVGETVRIRLLGGGTPFGGRVTGVARGITDRDNPTGSDLLADVNPTFNWVRLAQRVRYASPSTRPACRRA